MINILIWFVIITSSIILYSQLVYVWAVPGIIVGVVVILGIIVALPTLVTGKM